MEIGAAGVDVDQGRGHQLGPAQVGVGQGGVGEVGADLTSADLSHSQFAGADFHDAELEGARLFGADLGGAKGLTQGQLEGVCVDSGTRLPAGLWVIRGCHGPFAGHMHFPSLPAPAFPPTPPAPVSLHQRGGG